jgi:acetyl-CoA C-acetyltransferase
LIMDSGTYIAGSAQASLRTEEPDDHPARLMANAARSALEDARIKPDQVGAVACVEPLSWSYLDLGATVAGELGCADDVRQFWVPAGGTSPQDLLHQIGREVATGTIDCAVITGAEAMRTRRRAVREGKELSWPTRPDDANPVRGQKPFSSPLEQRHGLRMPIQAFPLFENALRAAAHRSADEQIDVAARLLAKNAQVAAQNPHAWFHDAPSAAEIATVTADNRLIAYPYTKRMNAIMDVNQAAAVVVVSERLMHELNLTDRCAAVLGGCGAEDAWFVSERTSFTTSPGMAHAINTALADAGLRADQIDAFDLYSCFPSAIQLGLAALQMNLDDPRPFSLTGGLAFAGGPGNAYVLHSLATSVTRLRTAPTERLLVTGIGMSNTKHSSTVLAGASHVPPNASGTTHYRREAGIAPADVREDAGGDARVVTYTIEYDRAGEPTNVICILELPDGGRTVANAANCDLLAKQFRASDPIGRAGSIVRDPESGRHLFTLSVPATM